MFTPVELEDLRRKLEGFAQNIDFQKYHTPRNLILALVTEVGALSEIFQWKGEVGAGLLGWEFSDIKQVADELSDILCYIVRISDVCSIDLGTAIQDRLRQTGGLSPSAVSARVRPPRASLPPECASTPQGRDSHLAPVRRSSGVHSSRGTAEFDEPPPYKIHETDLPQRPSMGSVAPSVSMSFDAVSPSNVDSQSQMLKKLESQLLELQRDVGRLRAAGPPSRSSEMRPSMADTQEAAEVPRSIYALAAARQVAAPLSESWIQEKSRPRSPTTEPFSVRSASSSSPTRTSTTSSQLRSAYVSPSQYYSQSRQSPPLNYSYLNDQPGGLGLRGGSSEFTPQRRF